MDKYGYIGIETLLNFCENSKNHAVTPNDFMRMNRVRIPERKRGKWVGYDGDWFKTMCKCSECGAMIDINEEYRNFFCYHCGARMDGEQNE